MWNDTPAVSDKKTSCLIIIIVVIAMKVLSVSITLCTILTLSRAGPLSVQQGQCAYQMQNCSNSTAKPGAFCPQCDSNGNYLPQQCSGSTGYCWCVNIISGQLIPNTTLNCSSAGNNEWYIQILPTPDDEDEDEECPNGWSNFGKRCFTFIDSPKPWVDAEVYCQFDGGNLASIHSHTENRFIMSLTRGDTHNFPQAWLGGFDAIHPGYWMWSDGSDFNYRNWYDDDVHDSKENNGDDDKESDEEDDSHSDEDEDEDDGDSHNDKGHDKQDKPDNNNDNNGGDGKKNCLRMNYEYDLKWFYASCRESLPFVCVKNVKPRPMASG